MNMVILRSCGNSMGNARKKLFLPIDKYLLRVYNINIPYGGIKATPCKDCLEKEMNVMPDKCSCCEKSTMRSDEERKKLIHRLNRIEGQIRGIRGMVEKNAYCPDILIQSAAVNSAVNSFNKELIASHIRGCVLRDIHEGKDEVIDELVATLQKLMK